MSRGKNSRRTQKNLAKTTVVAQEKKVEEKTAAETVKETVQPVKKEEVKPVAEKTETVKTEPVKATDKYYHYYDYDMICPKCAEGDSVAKCEKCNTYFKVEDLTEYEFNSEVHYFCEKDEPENINEINFSDKAVSAE